LLIYNDVTFTIIACISRSGGATEKEVSALRVALCAIHALLTYLSCSGGATEMEVSEHSVAFWFLHLLFMQWWGNGKESFCASRCLVHYPHTSHSLLMQWWGNGSGSNCALRCLL